MKQIFLSYSRNNANEKKELIKHLSVLKDNGLIREWNDEDIIAGDFWEQVIIEKLNSADIVIFLVSAEFLASDYINKVELKYSIQRYNNNEVSIFPVILNHCLWEYTILKHFQVTPQLNGKIKPISEWPDKNKAFYIVSLELLKLLNKDNLNIDRLTERIYFYKKRVLNQFLDKIFNLILVGLITISGVGSIYSVFILKDEIVERVPLIMISLVLLAICIIAYQGWKLIELKQIQKDLNY